MMKFFFVIIASVFLLCVCHGGKHRLPIGESTAMQSDSVPTLETTNTSAFINGEEWCIGLPAYGVEMGERLLFRFSADGSFKADYSFNGSGYYLRNYSGTYLYDMATQKLSLIISEQTYNGRKDEQVNTPYKSYIQIEQMGDCAIIVSETDFVSLSKFFKGDKFITTERRKTDLLEDEKPFPRFTRVKPEK